MGIRFYCPNGHKLHVKEQQAGQRGFCPRCDARLIVPPASTRSSSRVHPSPTGQAMNAPISSAAEAIDADAATDNIDCDRPERDDAVALASAATGAADANGPPPRVAALADAIKTELLREAEIPRAQPAAAAPATAADPFAEGLDLVWYVCPASGGEFGPADGELMQTWLGEGRITAGTLVWREGWPEWRDAAEVFGGRTFAGSLDAATTLAPRGSGDANALPCEKEAKPLQPANASLRATHSRLMIVAYAAVALLVLAGGALLLALW